MNLNLTATDKITESEARAAYTKALSAFDTQARNCEALAEELEEEQNLLNKLKGELDAAQLAFIQSVERAVFEPKTKDDDAKDKSESRTIGKTFGRTKDAPSKPHSEETAPPAVEATDAPVMFSASGTRPEVAAPAYASMDVTEADRDEDAMITFDEASEINQENWEKLATPSPGQRRAENISDLSPERAEAAADVLKTVDNILSDD